MPNDALDRGPWWQIFNDEVLNGLEAQLISPTKTWKGGGSGGGKSARWSARRRRFLAVSFRERHAASGPVVGDNKPNTNHERRHLRQPGISMCGARSDAPPRAISLHAGNEAALASARLADADRASPRTISIACPGPAADHFGMTSLAAGAAVAEDHRKQVPRRVAAKSGRRQRTNATPVQPGAAGHAPLQRAILEHAIAVLVDNNRLNSRFPLPRCARMSTTYHRDCLSSSSRDGDVGHPRAIAAVEIEN